MTDEDIRTGKKLVRPVFASIPTDLGAYQIPLAQLPRVPNCCSLPAMRMALVPVVAA
jgi:hypothetical protein